MSQTRRKRKERSRALVSAEIHCGLDLPEVVEALAGEALAAEREQARAEVQQAEQDALIAAQRAEQDALIAAQQAEQDALIAATQENEVLPDAEFHLERVLESLLFASDRPLTIANLRQLIAGADVSRSEVQQGLDVLVEQYRERGIVLHDVAGGYQFRTHPSSSEWIQKLIAGRPVRLSRAQLDTLAIIAYRQPITRPEIDDIRGVDSGSTLKILLDRSMVRILGKKEEAGRPLLYGTSKEFLEFFNLSELRDLPTLREFHELNDEGMAQVDKLGADITGIDVGAVAAQVAAEREAAATAAAERAEALAQEKLAAKEAAVAEKAALEGLSKNEEDVVIVKEEQEMAAMENTGVEENEGLGGQTLVEPSAAAGEDEGALDASFEATSSENAPDISDPDTLMEGAEVSAGQEPEKEELAEDGEGEFGMNTVAEPPVSFEREQGAITDATVIDRRAASPRDPESGQPGNDEVTKFSVQAVESGDEEAP